MSGTLRELGAYRRSHVSTKVGPIRRIVSSRSLTTAFVISLVVVASLLYVWQRVRALSLIAEVGELEQTNREYADQLLKLDSELADLSRVGRIVKMGKSMGLEETPLDRLYTARFKSSPFGAEAFGADEFWNSVKHSVASLPSIEVNEANAAELFDSDD